MNDFMTFVVHHWELWLAAVIVIILILYFEIREHAHGIDRLSTQETVQMINREHAIVVDVRDEKIFAEGHIRSAFNLPLKTLPTQLTQIEKYKEKPVILVCQAGMQSVRAAQILKQQGFKKVYSLKGGMGAWRVAGLPLAK